MKKVQNQFLSILCCKLTKKAVLTLKKIIKTIDSAILFYLKNQHLSKALLLSLTLNVTIPRLRVIYLFETSFVKIQDNLCSQNKDI